MVPRATNGTRPKYLVCTICHYGYRGAFIDLEGSVMGLYVDCTGRPVGSVSVVVDGLRHSGTGTHSLF